MKAMLLLTVLAVFLAHASCSCTRNTIKEIKECRDKANEILNQPYVCVETKARTFAALENCLECGADADLLSFAQKMDELDKKHNCNRERLTQCTTLEVITCAVESFDSIVTVAGFQLDNLGKLCEDIAKLESTVQLCSRCLLGAIPGSQTYADAVFNIVKISTTMINGGCNCTTRFLDQLAVLTTPGIKDCDLVSAVLNITKIAAADCILKLVNVPIQIPWITVVENYVATVLPLTGTLCPAIFSVPLISGAETSKLSEMAFLASAAAVPWTMASLCGRGNN